MTKSKPLLSLIVAAYNEEENIPRLYERVIKMNWSEIDADFELVFVDDHSSDSTPKVLRELAARDERVRWIRFSRNFGSHKAFTAGIEYSRGDAVVILAADLQDPPETVPQLLEKWRDGAKVVWAVRKDRPGEPLINKVFARIYYFLMRKFAVADLPETGADFFLIDRVVVEALRESRERNTSLMALIQWMGFDQASILYTKEARTAGVSKWNFSKRIKLAVDSFVGFSYAPIRAVSMLGMGFAVAGFLYTILLVTRRILFGAVVEGWTSLICIVLILSGIQLIMLGVIGEYLWRSLEEARARPRYVVEASHKIDRR